MGERIEANYRAENSAQKATTNKSGENNFSSSIFQNTNDAKGEISLNGKIEASYQGKMGDCFLLSAINTIANDDPYFFKDLIKDKGDTVEVTFKGIKDENGNLATYSLNKADLAKLDTEEGEELKYEYEYTNKDGLKVLATPFTSIESGYSKGDDDVLALEVAYGALRKDILDGKITDKDGKNIKLIKGEEDVLYGGRIKEAYGILSGNYSSENNIDTYGAQEMLNDKEGRKSIVGFSIEKTSNDKENIEIGGLKLSGRHAYSVVNIDDTGVSFINPHDSNKVMKLSLEDFKSVADSITYDEAKYRKNEEFYKTEYKLNSKGAQNVDLKDEVGALENRKSDFYKECEERKLKDQEPKEEAVEEKSAKAKEETGFLNSIKKFFKNIGNFFKNLV